MSKNPETNIQNDILIGVGGRADCLSWRNQTGVFRAMDDPNRIVNVGIKGSSDILTVAAIIITQEMVGKTVGVAVGIEVKTKTGAQSDRQKKWQAAFEKRGGIYLISRSKEEAIKQIDSLPSIIISR